MGNRTGLPVRGQPIFQRPRPGQSAGPAGAPGASGAPMAPGARPPFRPGERRPMHPTRSAPTPGGRPPMAGGRPGMGTRPGGPPRPGGLLGAAAGAPPPGAAPRPGARTGAPARRPGQRYTGPRGKQEGPMKGFTPPPRLSLSNEPMPITRAITISEGVSVKDLGRKARHPRQGSDRASAGSWRLCHHQPDAQRRPGPRHGPPLRSRELGHQL